jgi:hypothetical protein
MINYIASFENDMTLDMLAECETNLNVRIAGLSGTMESKHEQLEGLGIYAAYRDIFTGYQALLDDPEDGLEALKRVVFLAWYEPAEPCMFTGLFQLPGRTMGSAIAYLERDRACAAPDAELSWMLPWYYLIADYVFPDLKEAPCLARYLGAPYKTPPAYPAFSNRGQMGDYWNSISDGFERERSRQS